MSTFDNPFDAGRKLGRCSCGQYASDAEHKAESFACVETSEAKRYESVVASAVMRAVFPQEVARRAFLTSVGASAALGVLSQFFPIKMATDVFAQGAGQAGEDRSQGRLHPDHLRHADHHGRPARLL